MLPLLRDQPRCRRTDPVARRYHLRSDAPRLPKAQTVIQIRKTTDDDHIAISILLVSAFGQPNEARLIEALRADGSVAHELVAPHDGEVVGHACLSRLRAPEGWLALGPISVRTALQGQGLGGELVRYALDAARQSEAKAVVVVGDPIYYHRFGFVFDGPAELTSGYPTQYTGLYPIAPETASARADLVYPAPFADV